MTLRHYGLIFGCRPALCRHNIFLPKRFAGSHLNPLLAVVQTISLATGFRMPQPHTNQARPATALAQKSNAEELLVRFSPTLGLTRQSRT
jgi:hypothetical protein